MKHLLRAINPNLVPQTEPLNNNQVQNNAGGYVYRVSEEQRFLRFLILGTEGGTFYASEAKRTKLESDFVRGYAAKNGERAVELLLEVARENRAPKSDPSLLALAAVAKLGTLEARKAAWNALPDVARTGTHLLHFLEFVQLFGGWGRLTRGGVGELFNAMPLEKLAMWAVKYKSRDGWSLADALRLAHPKTEDVSRNAVYKFIVDGELNGEITDPALRLIRGHLVAAKATSDADAAAIMREYNLPIEAVPTEARGARVYKTALETNGLTWVLRNLGNLGKHGVLKQGMWDELEFVITKITDEAALRRARIHPIAVLTALLTYKNGRGVRGDGQWTVIAQIKDALETAFYRSFSAIKPSRKRFMLGIDVSGSMTMGQIAGVPGLTPNVAAAAMAMVTYRTEPRAHAHGFAHDFRDLGISPKDTLEIAMKKTQLSSFGSTDCALPMLYALERQIPVDAFVVYTDNETYFGKTHPSVALERYRQKMGIDARLIVVGMTATPFTIANSNDAGMLDVVGFDAAAPNVISSFAAKEF
jgi:60 kDa SS-A/Ro ribonucleoprotein